MLVIEEGVVGEEEEEETDYHIHNTRVDLYLIIGRH